MRAWAWRSSRKIGHFRAHTLPKNRIRLTLTSSCDSPLLHKPPFHPGRMKQSPITSLRRALSFGNIKPETSRSEEAPPPVPSVSGDLSHEADVGRKTPTQTCYFDCEVSLEAGVADENYDNLFTFPDLSKEFPDLSKERERFYYRALVEHRHQLAAAQRDIRLLKDENRTLAQTLADIQRQLEQLRQLSNPD
ncbi:hypothetical protein B0H12DRAFT_46071 [Mycena haematopus]|nr:hypothetical protein B0H12DRAFT_46071 [Mycena haematopus]